MARARTVVLRLVQECSLPRDTGKLEISRGFLAAAARLLQELGTCASPALRQDLRDIQGGLADESLLEQLGIEAAGSPDEPPAGAGQRPGRPLPPDTAEGALLWLKNH
jgi:hypothetical protein